MLEVRKIDAGYGDVQALFSLSLEVKEKEIVTLLGSKSQMAGSLSGGEQQMCAIGRALMSEPSVLLLDEPSLGLAPIVVDQMFDVIRQLHASGMTILLVEQNLAAALEVATRGYVIETGEVKLQGSAEELRSDPKIRSAYLGL